MQLEDRLFAAIYETICHFDGMYLLNYQNWKNTNYDEFKKCLDDMENRDLHVSTRYNRWILPSKVSNLIAPI